MAQRKTDKSERKQEKGRRRRREEENIYLLGAYRVKACAGHFISALIFRKGTTKYYYYFIFYLRKMDFREVT